MARSHTGTYLAIQGSMQLLVQQQIAVPPERGRHLQRGEEKTTEKEERRGEGRQQEGTRNGGKEERKKGGGER